jgi:nucleoside-diphosphate-sugar epimerase
MNILIIGGTRNLGHFLVNALLDNGHQVTVLNRGKTRDELPDHVERLRADRVDAEQLRTTLNGRNFDVVVDTTLYRGAEAEVVVDLFTGKTSHYIFLSTGQVYLVRENLARPFHESDYEGVVMPRPEPNTYDYEEWTYGYEKRQAEDILKKAWIENQFPYTTLRLPMVNGERDHFSRLYGYVLRIKDGGPILVPTTPNHALRHVYGGDVVRVITQLIESGQGKGKAYNISQDETVSLKEFLSVVGTILGSQPHILEVERTLLEANGFLPDCSPFSENWMSELDNTLSKKELGFTYTPLPVYMEKILAYYEQHPPQQPASYRRRNAEKNLILQS